MLLQLGQNVVKNCFAVINTAALSKLLSSNYDATPIELNLAQKVRKLVVVFFLGN